MKKSVYFLVYSLGVGGVEKSLINLICDMDPAHWDIHIGVLKSNERDPLPLPEHISIHTHKDYGKLLQAIQSPIRLHLINALKHLRLAKSVVLLYYLIQEKLTGNRLPYFNYLTKRLPDIPGKFDEAHAYAGPSEFIDYIICRKTAADKKYGWVHFDISKFGINHNTVSRLYGDYARIFIVSQGAKNVFDEVFPALADKTELRHNHINRELVSRMAEAGESFSDNFSGKRILTVGRLSWEKGQDIGIEALEIILRERDRERDDVKWYFIGDGAFRDYCHNLAKRLGIDDKIEFLGTKTNPYPYMRACDLYVQPSRHEGFCITLGEALVFGKPIVSTNFCGAQEQLHGRDNSIICPASPQHLSTSILEVLDKS